MGFVFENSKSVYDMKKRKKFHSQTSINCYPII